MLKNVFDFDPIVEVFNNFVKNSRTYPKYNLSKNKDGSWALEVAVAGFSRKNLSVKDTGGVLVIEGKSKQDLKEYFHKGISSKSFRLLFPISVDWKLKKASLYDGILSVTFTPAVKAEEIEIEVNDSEENIYEEADTEVEVDEDE